MGAVTPEEILPVQHSRWYTNRTKQNSATVVICFLLSSSSFRSTTVEDRYSVAVSCAAPSEHTGSEVGHVPLDV